MFVADPPMDESRLRLNQCFDSVAIFSRKVLPSNYRSTRLDNTSRKTTAQVAYEAIEKALIEGPTPFIHDYTLAAQPNVLFNALFEMEVQKIR